jgi:uncharacterized membrane protein (DUF373 family)
MAKGWIRKTTKKFFIIVNAIIVLFFLIAALSPYINPNQIWLHGLLALTTPYLILALILFTLILVNIKTYMVAHANYCVVNWMAANCSGVCLDWEFHFYQKKS